MGAELELSQPTDKWVRVTALHIATPVGGVPAISFSLMFGTKAQDGTFTPSYPRDYTLTVEEAVAFLTAFGDAQSVFFQTLVTMGLLSGNVTPLS